MEPDWLPTAETGFIDRNNRTSQTLTHVEHLGGKCIDMVLIVNIAPVT